MQSRGGLPRDKARDLGKDMPSLFLQPPAALTSLSIRRFIVSLTPLLGVAGLLALGLLAPSLESVLNLALPFFGLIALGFFCARQFDIDESGLKWMTVFIVYVALPALFFNLISVVPLEKLANWRFVVVTTSCTLLAYGLALGAGLIASRGDLAEGAIQGVAGAYSNIGYMGPGLTLAALGPQAAVPTALIFVFDSILLFTLVPFLMALAGAEHMTLGQTARLVARRILTHPFNVATFIAVCAAYGHFVPPPAIGKMLLFLQNAAAPCALFTLGVTVSLRPIRRISGVMPVLTLIKLVVHPTLVWFILSLHGDFGRTWTYTAMLMASLPPALNVFVLAQQYHTWVERASAVIVIGTVASVFTVTLLLYLMGNNSIPWILLH